MSKDSRIQDELSSSMTGGRLRRYAKVTSAMGGLAARLAGERYLGIKINREQHASDLRAALGGLKGPLMKVAQILATIPDLIYPLKRLQQILCLLILIYQKTHRLIPLRNHNRC